MTDLGILAFKCHILLFTFCYHSFYQDLIEEPVCVMRKPNEASVIVNLGLVERLVNVLPGLIVVLQQMG